MVIYWVANHILLPDAILSSAFYVSMHPLENQSLEAPGIKQCPTYMACLYAPLSCYAKKNVIT